MSIHLKKHEHLQIDRNWLAVSLRGPKTVRFDCRESGIVQLFAAGSDDVRLLRKTVSVDDDADDHMKR